MDVASCNGVPRILLLVLASALAACCPQSSLVDEIFLIRNPDAETQALIDACRDPAHPDCVPLCQKMTGSSASAFVHCEMHPDRDGYQQVHVGYYEQLPGCL
jgi:hypothetical protein